MKIKDQIMLQLSFGLHDTTFDEYAEEFGITLPASDILSCIIEADGHNVQNMLLDDLFMTIIRTCLEEYDIISTWEDIEPEWLVEQGFDWESNGVASWLSFRGVRYTKKDDFYAAVNTALGK